MIKIKALLPDRIHDISDEPALVPVLLGIAQPEADDDEFFRGHHGYILSLKPGH